MWRRYTRRSLSQRLREAGSVVERAFYFNLVGVTIGWWVNARLRRASRIPVGQLRYFDTVGTVSSNGGSCISLPFGQSVIAIGAVGA